MSTQGLANKALHTDGAPVSGCARHGAPPVSAKSLGGLLMSDQRRNLKQEAEWLRVRLEYGFIAQDDVVGWADRQLLVSECADPNVSDVAMAGKMPIQDLLGLLAAFPGTADRTDIVRSFLAEVAGRVRADSALLQRIPVILATLNSDDEGLNLEMASKARRFENALELVEYAGHSVAEYRERVLAFLDANSTPPNKALNPVGLRPRLNADVRPQMERWSPATENEVSSIVERDLRECPEELFAFFAEVQVPLRAVPIARCGEIESVYVVAERDGVVIYYEDIEEGFNLSRLGDDGGIASPGWEQWDLCLALRRLSAQQPAQAAASIGSRSMLPLGSTVEVT